MQRGANILRFVLFLLTRLIADANGASDASLHRAYVWQRVWTPALCESLTAHAAEFGAIDVLTTEITFKGKPDVFYSDVKWEALKAFRGELGLVVRIGSCKNEFRDDSMETGLVLSVCQRVLADAAQRGVRVAELQIDFDAATERLRNYKQLLEFLKTRIGAVKLTITVLPTWMQNRQFAELVRHVDGFVLQVHSLEKPKHIGDAVSLCDAASAMRQIQKAATFARPFRVALPTYGYRLLFAPSGRFVGLESEGPQAEWPHRQSRREVWAETAEVVRIVRFLSKEPQPHFKGICWFRFPTGTDDLCWRWETLAEVMKGRAAEAKLSVELSRSDNGAGDIILKNEGTGRWLATGCLLEWTDALLVAGDTINGWTLIRRGKTGAYLQPPSDEVRQALQPGETLKIGWLRLDRNAKISMRENVQP